jgi:hypothetical protein
MRNSITPVNTVYERTGRFGKTAFVGALVYIGGGNMVGIVAAETTPPPPPAPAPQTTSNYYYQPVDYTQYLRPTWQSSWVPGERRIDELEYVFGPEVFGAYFLPPIPPKLADPDYADVLPVPASYPVELADCVGEIFYMPYGEMLVKSRISSARRHRIEAYLAGRREAADLLRRHLRESALPDEKDASELKLLAETQALLLRDQERQAEEIRADLTEAGFFKVTSDAISKSKIKEDADPVRRAADTKRLACLKAAQFHLGLSLDQRLLLQEGFECDAVPELREAQDIPFLPMGARISLPKGLPGDLKEKLRGFQSIRALLKAELVELVLREEHEFFHSSRTTAYRELARAQAERFRRLEVLAEEIRQGLSALGCFDESAEAALPGNLTQLLSGIQERKTALWRELVGRLKELRGKLPADKIELVSKEGVVAISITPDPQEGVGAGRNRKVIFDELKAFNEDLARRIAALAEEYAAARKAIAQYQGAKGQNESGASVDERVAAFVKSYREQERSKAYQEYRIAVLKPGLSPEQRRLLFNAVQCDLFKRRHSLAR